MNHYPRSRELYWSKSSDWEKWPNEWYERGPGYTLLIDGKYIMCAGVMFLKKDVGESWMVLSTLFYKYQKECFRAVRDKLNEIITQYQLKRIQTYVLTDFPEAERWVMHLGFNNPKPDLGPMGEDLFVYTRVCQ